MEIVNRIINNSLILLTIACSLLVVCYYISHSNQGFNLLDEGFYLLSSAFPVDTRQQLTSFHYYLHGIMQINDNIVFLRVFGLAIPIASSALLAFCFVKVFFQIPQGDVVKRATLTSRFPYICTAPVPFSKIQLTLLMICAMVTVSSVIFMFPIEPNYNSLALSGTYIFYSLLILLMTQKRRFSSLYWFLLGFIAIFVFFNKFTTGMVLIFLSFIAVWIFKDKKNAVKGGLFLLSGMILHFVIYFSFMQNWQQFLQMYHFGFQAMKTIQSRHSVLLLIDYYHQMIQLFILSYKKYKIIFYTGLSIVVLQKLSLFAEGIGRRTKGFSYGILIVFFILSLKIDPDYGLTRLTSLSAFYFSLILILLLTGIVNLKFSLRKCLKQLNWLPLILMLLLLLLPFIISVGTNNFITIQILLSIGAWIPIIVLLAALQSAILGQSFLYLTVAGISVLSAWYALTNMHAFPYGLYGNLSAQKYLTQVNSSSLYLDANSSYIIEKTREQLKNCGFKPKDYLLGLTDMPGLIYAVEGRSPGCPWYFGLYAGSDKFAKFCLSLAPDTKPAYILLGSYQGQVEGFSESLLKNDFKDYALCGEVNHIPTEGGVCCKVPLRSLKIFRLNRLNLQ